MDLDFGEGGALRVTLTDLTVVPKKIEKKKKKWFTFWLQRKKRKKLQVNSAIQFSLTVLF